MTREQLVEVYQHTKEVCELFEKPKSEKFSQSLPITRFTTLPGEIIVEPLDTVSALIKYATEGKSAVLNMASNTRKGGGVEKGAMAQEECLFRCSNLFTIPDEFYPLEVNDYIYTQQATFVKSADYGIIWPVDADVITIAALNMNKENKYYNEKDSDGGYENIMLNKMHMMIDAAISNDCQILILGAWGCGVFKNDPATVADLFSVALKSKHYFFKKIVFAVINDTNSVGNNYQIFHDKFNGI
jgi:uncharacterized protein (TIGR02452 family)